MCWPPVGDNQSLILGKTEMRPQAASSAGDRLQSFRLVTSEPDAQVVIASLLYKLIDDEIES